MNTAERIYREAKTLPETQAKEVLNFLEFLKIKLKKAAATEVTKTLRNDSLPGFGMWSDRENMSATFTDNEIKIQGVDALIKSLGEVQAERFISLILREPFDYTEWQKKLWTSQDIEDISKMAMDFQKNKGTSE